MSDKPEECECCQFETGDLTSYPRRTMDGGDKWLCNLCASTAAGTAHDYPDQFWGQSVTLKAICYVGNAILAAIEKAATEGL